MNLRTMLTEPSKPARPAFQYGMLAFLLILFGSYAYFWFIHPRYGVRGPVDYMAGVLVLMLLFSHLAYQFNWPMPMMVAVGILAWSWLVLGCFYVFFAIAYSLLFGHG